jgi:hypothetical protein
MDHADFYTDRKYCPECLEYVPYLMSLETSFCASCGSEVRLFSKEDWESFHASMKDKRPKGGRPRKGEGFRELDEDRESA